MSDVLPGLLEAVRLLTDVADAARRRGDLGGAKMLSDAAKLLKARADHEDTGKAQLIVCPKCGAETAR